MDTLLSRIDALIERMRADIKMLEETLDSNNIKR